MRRRGKDRLITKKLVIRAVKDSFIKLAPKTEIKNPVMFLVYLCA